MKDPKKTKKRSRIAYRSAIGFDEQTAARIFSDADRKGIGIADVIRIAVSEYLDRLPPSTQLGG